MSILLSTGAIFSSFNSGGGGSGFSDDFNRADEALSASANYTAVVNPGTSTTHSPNIVSNVVKLSDPATNNQGHVRIDAAGAEIMPFTWTSKLRFATNSTYLYRAWFYVRWVDDDNWVRLDIYDAGDIYCTKRVTGTDTDIGNVSIPGDFSAINVDNNITITDDGTDIDVQVNGGTVQTFTDSTHGTETTKAFGLLHTTSGTANMQVDDWSIS